MEDLIAQIQARYSETYDLKAKFTQEVTIKAVKKTEREEGLLFIKTPKKMLWHYLKPKTKKLIITPDRAWLYLPDEKVVYVQSSEELIRSRLALNILSGSSNLSEDFRFSFSSEKIYDERGNYLLTLIPKRSDLGVDRLFLTIDKNNFQIIQCRFSDAFGNTTRIRLTDVEINTGLSDSLFHFKPPRGVDVFNMQ